MGMGFTWVLMFCANVCPSLTFRLVRVDTITVRTTMRLWHDMHVASGTAYDFEHMFAPAQTHHEFMACVLNDEVHALARCDVVYPKAYVAPIPMVRRRQSSVERRIDGVAHAPHGIEAADTLIRMLAMDGMLPHPLLRDRQPRWSVAMLFYVPS